MQATAILNRRIAVALSFLMMLGAGATAFTPAETPLLGAEIAHAGGDDDDLDDLEIQR